jgi:hypothetical protein
MSPIGAKPYVVISVEKYERLKKEYVCKVCNTQSEKTFSESDIAHPTQLDITNTVDTGRDETGSKNNNKKLDITTNILDIPAAKQIEKGFTLTENPDLAVSQDLLDSTKKEDKELDESIPHFFAERYRDKIKKILIFIRKHVPQVTSDIKGRIVLNKKPVPFSHITDFIGLLIYHKRGKEQITADQRRFLFYLQENNFPKVLVNSPKIKRILTNPINLTEEVEEQEDNTNQVGGNSQTGGAYIKTSFENFVTDSEILDIKRKKESSLSPELKRKIRKWVEY